MAERAITTRRAASLLAPPLALMGLIFLLSAQPGGGDHGAHEGPTGTRFPAVVSVTGDSSHRGCSPIAESR